MGSSMVIMCSSRSLLILSSMAASVVDLPEPVGPVTRTSPRGLSHNPFTTSGNPRASKPLISHGMVRKTAPTAPRWLKTLPRKRARYFKPNEKSSSRFSSKRCFCASVSTLYASDLVSAAVNGGISSGRKWPCTRTRGAHHMPCQRGFNGNFRRFKISNFSHQNDVRVLPQKCPQRRGEVQPNLLFHLHLVDSAQLKFDRIFRGHNVGVDLIQPRHRRVQRVRLTRTRRSRDQHHSVRLQNTAFEFRQRFLFEPQLGHVQPQILFVQQPQHNFFAV